MHAVAHLKASILANHHLTDFKKLIHFSLFDGTGENKYHAVSVGRDIIILMLAW